MPDTALRSCDLVMKGGITSGIVYPGAVHALSRAFRFRNIGGTSAGAIAAVLTAAAEFGRTSGRNPAAFDQLHAIPQALGADGFLFRLFRPQARTRGLHHVLTAAIGHDPMPLRLLRLAAATLARFPLGVLLGLAPGVVLVYALRGLPAGPATIAAGVVTALVLLLGAVAGGTLGLLRAAGGRLPANGFGLCRGFDRDARADDAPHLTAWLHATIQALAGLPPDQPLTTGMLWRGHAEPAERWTEGATREINLEAITTNLTHGRPHRIPDDLGALAFDVETWRDYFPAPVVDVLVREGAEVKHDAQGARLRWLPEAEHIPVLVLARLSLSFPLLISAVPLHARNWSRPRDARGDFERCWFSDGGICSNFPVHFFDALIPRWPTFAINLRPFTHDYPPPAAGATETEEDVVYMPRRNGDGLAAWWSYIEKDDYTWRPVGGLGQLARFLRLVLDTSREWQDNAALRMPGFRDRVVHIKLDERAEGGLNLRMPPDLIARVARRGELAGALLARRYTTEPTPEERAAGLDVSWRNHRWVRYRTAMSLLQRMLRGFGRTLDAPADGAPAYRQMVPSDDEATAPTSYKWTAAQRALDPWAATQELANVVRAWDDDGLDFSETAPRPRPELRPHLRS